MENAENVEAAGQDSADEGDPREAVSGQVAGQDVSENDGQGSSNGDDGTPTEIWIGLGVLLITSFQAWILYRQSVLTGRQTEIANDALAATKKAADAAEKAATISEAALELTERPYLSVGGWTSSEIKPASQFRPKCIIKNTGRTPAKVKRGWFGTYVGDDFANAPKYPGEPLPVAFEIGGNEGTRQPFGPHDELTHEDYTAIVEGRTRFWLYGFFDYGDIFGKERSVFFSAIYYVPEKSFLGHEGGERALNENNEQEGLPNE